MILRSRSVARLGFLAFLATAAARPGVSAETPYVAPAEARLRADVTYLADDLREGRGAGTKGLDLAADYIAAVFREAGLKTVPGADGYFQPFTIPGNVRAVEPLKLALVGPDGASIASVPTSEFTPLQRGGSGKLDGLQVVFAGYGITAKDEDRDLDYDDYAGLDVKGKAVLVLRQEPNPEDGDSPFKGADTTTYATFRHKARNAADHGAAAILMVNNRPSLQDGQDTLLPADGTDGDSSGAPFLMITRAVADRILKAGGAPTLDELEKCIDQDAKPNSKALEGVRLDLEAHLERRPFQVKNVIGALEGSGPHADETIVIGAHYDHVGLGGAGSLAPGVRAIHNGADDNASGTALIMELARRMARRSEPLPRRLVFMAFSGEERGLLGSRHYVDHPLYPLDQTIAMLNFDMVGRLNKEDELTIFGAPSIPGLDALTAALATSQGLKARIVPDTSMEFGASDHASFYRKNVPVFFAFTGTHPDYHRPSDDTEKVNFEGMARIADFAELILLDIARRPKRPEFTKLAAPAPRGGLARAGSPRGNGAYLGTRPAYGEEGVKGVKLDGVSEGSPAEKAGLKEGDIIVKLADKPVESVEGLFEFLIEKKPGDTLDVVVQRDGKEHTFKVTLGTRPGAN